LPAAAPLRRTPLNALHRELGARMVDFGGWDMPVAYGSQIEEHHAVRRHAGQFDVSHMCVIDLTGLRVREFLRHLLANDVGRLRLPGKALYSCLLDEAGHVLDDLIVYFMTESWFRMVVNAGTRDKDLAWIRARAAEAGRDWGIVIIERVDLAMIAVQGPAARELLAAQLPVAERAPTLALEPFFGRESGAWFVARTGYTGEDGFEVMLPQAEAAGLWRRLNAAGVASCGLGARDTLRLEAGMNLYGNDMDESRNPLESGLAWTVAFEPPERDFIGRKALEAVRAAGSADRFVGLVLEGRGVLRSHQKLTGVAGGHGELTSGTFSPTLERSIGLARVSRDCSGAVQVDVRGKLLPARIVKLPFVRHGRVLV
jgi:aminomethyltransferase